MNLYRRLTRILVANRSLLVFFLMMLVFRSALADWMYVPSGSMNPTLIEGDRIFVDKAAYGLRIPFTTVRLTQGSDPQRGDIVIFDSPEDGSTLVKRVIGLPGDTIEMRNERLFINGVQAQYAATIDGADADLLQSTRAQDHRYLNENLGPKPHSIMVLPARPAMRSFAPTVVASGYYLMLGDSRDNSKDSRFIGLVPRDSIVGRAFRVAYSLDSDRWYRPRAGRFLAPLQ